MLHTRGIVRTHHVAHVHIGRQRVLALQLRVVPWNTQGTAHSDKERVGIFRQGTNEETQHELEGNTYFRFRVSASSPSRSSGLRATSTFEFKGSESERDSVR